MQFTQWRHSCLGAVFVALVWVSEATGEVGAARDLMEEGHFVKARAALWPSSTRPAAQPHRAHSTLTAPMPSYEVRYKSQTLGRVAVEVSTCSVSAVQLVHE